MKSWQIVLIVLVAVAGVALVVFFATRRDSEDPDADANGSMAGNDPADIVTGIGNALTGLAGGITRAATPSAAS